MKFFTIIMSEEQMKLIEDAIVGSGVCDEESLTILDMLKDVRESDETDGIHDFTA